MILLDLLMDKLTRCKDEMSISDYKGKSMTLLPFFEVPENGFQERVQILELNQSKRIIQKGELN